MTLHQSAAGVPPRLPSGKPPQTKAQNFFERPDSSQAPAIKQAQEGASRLDAIYA